MSRNFPFRESKFGRSWLSPSWLSLLKVFKLFSDFTCFDVGHGFGFYWIDHRTLGGNWYLSPFPLCVFVGVKMGRRGWGNSSLYQAAYVLTVLSPQLMVSSIFVGEGGRGGGTFYT